MKNHSEVLIWQGEFAQAETLLLEAYQVPAGNSAGAVDARRQLADELAELYERIGKSDQAEQWHRRSASTAPATGPATSEAP